MRIRTKELRRLHKRREERYKLAHPEHAAATAKPSAARPASGARAASTGAAPRPPRRTPAAGEG